jgi:phospholipid/cholesterol/gamma-HCH transport system substrate-binding protein
LRDPGLRDHGAEIRVGILVLLAAVALVVGLFWISNSRIGGATLRVTGVADDAGQITPDSKIFLHGVEVGAVKEVRLDAGRAVLDLVFFAELDLPADTRGVIQPAGFLGTQMVEILPGAATTSLVTGDTIDVGRASDLMSLAGSLGDETGVLLERVEGILSEQMVENLNASSEAFTGAMTELEELMRTERDAIHGLLANLDVTAGHLADLAGSPELDRTLASLDTLTSRLAGASASFDTTSSALATITTRLADGEGSLGRMMTDDALYDSLTETLENLRAASEEVAMLMKDVRERPARYLKDIKISVF